ncbi:hypothetical protein ACH4FX_39030 [Streptomyces sp. NPDC018019]|uniref:hypothetical protein n=1 Tax=Streptomyces sp. NPDC018019 TaxID=3365030 RepID=UPI0037927489
MPITTDYGFDPQPGDEIGTEAVLLCCDQTMSAAAPDEHGIRVHTCGVCATRAEIDICGLLGDIDEPEDAA